MDGVGSRSLRGESVVAVKLEPFPRAGLGQAGAARTGQPPRASQGRVLGFPWVSCPALMGARSSLPPVLKWDKRQHQASSIAAGRTVTAGPLRVPAAWLFWTSFPFSPTAKAVSELKELNYSDKFREIFLPDGQPLLPGMFVRRPDLAAVLELVGVEGLSAFYSGNWTQEIISEVSHVCPCLYPRPQGTARARGRLPCHLPKVTAWRSAIAKCQHNGGDKCMEPPFSFLPLSLQWYK